MRALRLVETTNPIKQETWLPLFTGYYESIFDGSNDFVECETEIELSDYKYNFPRLVKEGVTHEFYTQNLWDYCDFTKSYEASSESICDGLMQLDSAGIILEVRYQSTSSPKYYNFATDSINCEIIYDSIKLKDYILSNLTAFETYIENKYTSRDGFSSSYSNDVNDWLNVDDYSAHTLGSVLQFVLLNEDDDAVINLYYESNISEAFMNNVEIDYDQMIKDFKAQQTKVL